MNESRCRYFVTFPGQPELEVSFAAWCKAERAAGFHAPDGYAATAGFTGHGGISGRMEFITSTPPPPPLPSPREKNPDAVTSWVPARVTLTDDLTVAGRGIGLGRPGAGSAAELGQAARSATADDPVWIMDGETPVAVIIPAGEYHVPGACCCKNCPWNGHHEEKNHG